MDLNVSAEAQTGQHQQQTNDHALATSNQHQQQQQQQHQQQQQQQQQNQQPPYTIPGILHYLQYEWHRFEVERQEWEVEKAELSARIALLQGEKKSHENLRHDLIRRIKMLEYCLRMERAKYHRLKHGTEPTPVESASSTGAMAAADGQIQQAVENSNQSEKAQQNDDAFNNTNNFSTITYGRELLKHYLQEIGYTDTIIDLRSNRMRTLLGIDDQSQPETSNQSPSDQATSNVIDSNSASNNINAANNIDSTKAAEQSRPGIPVAATTNRNTNQDPNKKSPFSSRLANNAAPASKQPGDVGDAESSVLATFGFLYDNEAMRDPGSHDDDEEEAPDESIVDAADRAASTAETEYSYFDKECNEVTAMIKQKIDILNNGKPQPTWDSRSNDHQRIVSGELSQADISSTTPITSSTSTSAKNWCSNAQKSDVVDIGELATLTTLGSENSTDDSRKKQWTNKYRLQSHYDCVRALRFSERDSLLVTASEDETIKLWHLTRPSSAGSKSRQPSLPPSINAISSLEGSTLDIEPLHTYRGHTSRILAITTNQDYIFSGAQNGELFMWKIISDPSTADQYDKFDSSLLFCRFAGHQDAIWSLELIDHSKSEPLLCSAGADQTIKIWSITGDNKEPLKTINLESSPTCIARMPPYNVHQAGVDIAVSSCDGKIRLYDLTACMNDTESNTQPAATLECDDSHRINSIVIHPTLPYLASADSNRSIKFWDLKTNTCKLTMVAHLDEVTSLACDPTGKYLLSASHDCSARLWLFEEKSCIQEITSHRKKFDEGIFAVAFHPSLSHFATAGADGLAKVFV